MSTALDQRPVRCSWCFGKFLHNHRPKPVAGPDGQTRWVHWSCADSMKKEHTLIWPAQTIWPDKDE